MTIHAESTSICVADAFKQANKQGSGDVHPCCKQWVESSINPIDMWFGGMWGRLSFTFL